MDGLPLDCVRQNASEKVAFLIPGRLPEKIGTEAALAQRLEQGTHLLLRKGGDEG